MAATVRARELQESAAWLLAQVLEYGGRAATSAYKYVTVEAPDPKADYFFRKADGENVKLMDEKTRQLAIQIETLEREKTRWTHVATIGFGSLGSATVAVGQWTGHPWLAALCSIPVMTGGLHAADKIAQNYNSQITLLSQQILQKLAAGSQKKSE